MATLWCIGANFCNECALPGENQGQWQHKEKLTLCEWSLSKQVVSVTVGFRLHIYAIKTERDELLCFGFIREAQKGLLPQTNTFYNIPTGVYTLCTQYVGDIFVEYWSAGYNQFGGCGQGIKNQNPCALGQIKESLDGSRIDNFYKISSGCRGRSVLWIKNDGTLLVHGMNLYGMLGFTGDLRTPYSPMLSEFSQQHSDLKCIDAASSNFRNIIVCSDGSAWAAGGVLADPEGFKQISFVNEQEKMVENPHIVAVAARNWSAIFLTANGSVLDEDENGKNPVLIPFFVENKLKVHSVCCGFSHSLALTDDYQVFAWGNNKYGQCGVNLDDKSVDIPMLISCVSKTKMKRIECGAFHSGCVSVDDVVFLWGSNSKNESCGGKQDRIRVPHAVNEYVLKESKKEIIDFSLGYLTTVFLLR